MNEEGLNIDHGCWTIFITFQTKNTFTMLIFQVLKFSRGEKETKFTANAAFNVNASVTLFFYHDVQAKKKCTFVQSKHIKLIHFLFDYKLTFWGDFVHSIGRKKTLCIAAMLMMVSTIGLSWVSSYIAYVLVRIFVGASYGGTNCGFILGLDLLVLLSLVVCIYSFITSVSRINFALENHVLPLNIPVKLFCDCWIAKL